jgi:hypothetical protein
MEIAGPEIQFSIFECVTPQMLARVRRRSGIGCKVEQTTDPARRIGRRLSLQRLQ